MKIHHVAYAVSSIEKSKSKFELLGFVEKQGVIEDLDRNIKINFMENKDGDNSIIIELIEAMDNNSAISNLINKMSGAATPYHICYEVDSIEKAIIKYKEFGFILTQKFAPAIAINNRNVAFMFHKDVGIIELIE